MLKAIVILFIACMLTWIITIFYERFKIVAKFFTFLSILTVILGAILFFSGYDPLNALKEGVLYYISSLKNGQSSDEKLSSPIEVLIPAENKSVEWETASEVENSDPVSTYETATTILNISETAYRNDSDELFIMWVPIAGQNEYRLKIEVDDPFSDAEPVLEFLCADPWYYVDVSAYDYKTVMFASVAVWNDGISQWVYSSPLSFTLY